MKIPYIVGNVIEVNGTKVRILMNDRTDLEQIHYNGIYYAGVSNGSYVGIIRGSNRIIGRIEREYLEDLLKDPTNHTFSKGRYQRIIEVSIIGNLINGEVEYGLKLFPLIYAEVTLLTFEEISTILTANKVVDNNMIPIGSTLSSSVPIGLPWQRLFNTHIGVFGNTGSGKSNTLTKLFTELFNLNNSGRISLQNSSSFIVIDFNGEYVGESVLKRSKQVIKLGTGKKGGDKLPLPAKYFWNIDTLAILFSATEKVQKPFLHNAIKYFVDAESNDISLDNLINGIGSAFYNVFKSNNNQHSLLLLNKLICSIEEITNKNRDEIWSEDIVALFSCLWHSSQATYYIPNNFYINTKNDSELKQYRSDFQKKLEFELMDDSMKNNVGIMQKITISVVCHLIYCLSYNTVQYDFIAPLISRIESQSAIINKIFKISSDFDVWNDVLTVVSLRDCNTTAKKLIPLLLTNYLYDLQKEVVANGEKIGRTTHLIIDEAHNILSAQSNREDQAWKDYRLEVFEEIIKEGRKFGFYVTLASQRPADISPTIMSQIHNYFIHRLVNDNDLFMISNTISTLDSVSKRQIPTLAPGQCIITGTSYELPILVQVKKLSTKESPNSENANLEILWNPSGKYN
ncbi:MAG: DUF87 domain-containing protein [Erysipelotrichia bacterium]|nr:DUF87 domain-containing protein [Erysipelotrichia bacterium]